MKKTTTKLLAVLLCIFMVSALVACGGNNSNNAGSNPSDDTAVIPDGETLRIGTSASDTSAITQAANWFAEEMSSRTGGLVTVKVYSSDSISGGTQTKGIEII